MSSCVNIEYLFADSFKAIYEFREAAPVSDNIYNN